MRATKAALAACLCTVLGTSAIQAHAQATAKTHRVALILTTSPLAELAGPEPVHPGTRAFLRAMRSHGYAEGRNLVFERRSAEGAWERTAGIVADLARLKTEVIVVANTALALRTTAVTKEIPIVVISGDDLVRAGLARSLARPGGNVTGTTSDVGTGAELKRLELFAEVLPKGSRVAFVGTRDDWNNHWGTALRQGALALGMQLHHVESTPKGYGGAFAQVAHEKPAAFFVARSVIAYGFRASIGEFAAGSRLPSACGSADYVEHGCLMSYGLNVGDLFVRAAGYVDRILRGARPADLPIEQPSRFELAVNLKTARQIGLAVPPAFLARADRVIE